MKTNCDLIRDLLPLYTDNVCSAASQKAVENHLSKCEACKKELALLRGEFHADTQPPEESEEAVLKAANSAWKRGRHRAFLKGGIITLIVITLVAAITCHCLLPMPISPKSFHTGDVFQHQLFRWDMPAFAVRLLCAKQMVKNPVGDANSPYDLMLWSYRACTVNGQKGDIGFYFKDGLMILEILFNEKKDLEWSYQLLEEFEECYGPATPVLSKKGEIIHYRWELGDSCLQFRTGDIGKPCIMLFESTARE